MVAEAPTTHFQAVPGCYLAFMLVRQEPFALVIIPDAAAFAGRAPLSCRG